MKVGTSCIGCDHCDYEIFDDYGCYDPGYYCDLKECPYEEEDLNRKIVRRYIEYYSGRPIKPFKIMIPGIKNLKRPKKPK